MSGRTVFLVVLSFPILISLAWLGDNASRNCVTFLEEPILALSIVLTILMVTGIVGLCVPLIERVYWVLMTIMILLLMCFSMFALAVSENGSGYVMEGRGYKEYKLGDYSHWKQKTINADKNWNGVKSCLQYYQFCRPLSEEANVSAEQFYRWPLTPIESGCCKPPQECDFAYKSPTVWPNTTTSRASTIPDCKTWETSTELCFDCQSCKAGVLANLRSDWIDVSYFTMTFLILMIIVLIVSSI